MAVGYRRARTGRDHVPSEKIWAWVATVKRCGFWYPKSHARRAEVRAAEVLQAPRRRSVDGPAARRGHGWRRDPLLRHQPAQGPHREPGYEKLAAIAKATGFPPELWFEEGAGPSPAGPRDDGRGIAGRAEHRSSPSGTRHGRVLHERGGRAHDAGDPFRGGRRGHQDRRHN
jgi:hypothetical protein